MEIEKDKENLIVKIPLWQNAEDYFGSVVGKIPNIIGVVSQDIDRNEEIGFHQLIDMTYKDKEPQIDGLLISYHGTKESFKKLCKKLDIEYFEYPICAYCKKTIYGVFTFWKKGKYMF